MSLWQKLADDPSSESLSSELKLNILVLLCVFLRIFSASCVSSSCEWLESDPVDLFHLAWTILLTCSRLFISSSANKPCYFSQICSPAVLLTVFVLQAAELDLVGLVLSLLLQSAGAAGQLVLLFSGFGSALKRK